MNRGKLLKQPPGQFRYIQVITVTILLGNFPMKKRKKIPATVYMAIINVK